MNHDTDSGDRINRTRAYYDAFAEQVAARIDRRDFGRAFDAFAALVVRGHPVIDIGSGSGAHLEELKRRGIDAIGVEPSSRMRQLAGSRGLTVIDGTFESLDQLGLPAAGGIWCAASLLHVPLADVPNALANVRALLVDGAPMFVTVRLGDGASWDRFDSDDSDTARFIQLFDGGELERMIVEAQLDVIESWTEESTWGRPSTWISILAQKP